MCGWGWGVGMVVGGCVGVWGVCVLKLNYLLSIENWHGKSFAVKCCSSEYGGAQKSLSIYGTVLVKWLCVKHNPHGNFWWNTPRFWQTSKTPYLGFSNYPKIVTSYRDFSKTPRFWQQKPGFLTYTKISTQHRASPLAYLPVFDKVCRVAVVLSGTIVWFVPSKLLIFKADDSV